MILAGVELPRELIQSERGLKFHHSVLLFITGLILFVCYLISANLPSPPPAFAFWAIIIFLFFFVVWQTGKVKNNPIREGIVLAEIFFLGFALHLIFVLTVPFGLYGRDIHWDYYAAKTIAEHGWPVPEGVDILSLTRIVSDWPAIHFLGNMFSSITGLPLFSVENMWAVTKWLPSLIGSISTLLIFIIAKRMYRSSQVALLAAFALSTPYFHVMFHSWFVRQTIAFPILFLVVYFYILRFTDPSKSSNVRNSCLPFLSMIALLFAHHLTFLILLIFLVLLLLNSFLLDRIGKATLRWPALSAKSSSLSIPVLAFILFFLYSMFIGEPIFATLVIFVKALASPVFELGYEVVMVERTLQEQVKFYARLFFYGAFALLLINQLLKNRQRNIIWDAMGFSFIIVVVAFIAGDILTGKIGVGIARIESLIWPFILISVAYAICQLRHDRLPIYLLVLFALFQIFLIPAYVYNPNAEPPYHRNVGSMSYSLSTYRAVKWFEGEGKVAAGDMTTVELLGGLRQSNVVIDLDLFMGDLNRIKYYDWLVIRAENFKVLNRHGPLVHEFLGMRLSELTFNEIENHLGLAKIYAVKDFFIFKVQQ